MHVIFWKTWTKAFESTSLYTLTVTITVPFHVYHVYAFNMTWTMCKNLKNIFTGKRSFVHWSIFQTSIFICSYQNSTMVRKSILLDWCLASVWGALGFICLSSPRFLKCSHSLWNLLIGGNAKHQTLPNLLLYLHNETIVVKLDGWCTLLAYDLLLLIEGQKSGSPAHEALWRV